MSDEFGWDLQEERELWRAICAPYGLLDDENRRVTHPESFYWFNKIAMGVDAYMVANPRDQWFQPALHKPFCAWLQFHHIDWYDKTQRGILERKKLMAILPRFTGKTFCCTKSSSIWAMLMEPDLCGLIGSEVMDKAERFLDPVKSILEGGSPYAWFTWLYGNWKSRDREWTDNAIVHARRQNLALTDPSILCWAVGAGVTGFHPDYGWIDDPTSEEKLRDAGGGWLAAIINSFAALVPAFRTNSFLGVALTRKRDGDVAGTYLDAKKDGIASWSGMPLLDERLKQAMRPGNPNSWHVYFWQARDPLTGESTLPMWTTQALDDYEEAQPLEFASEMMNEPGSGEHQPLTMDQIDGNGKDDPGIWIDEDKLPKDMTYTIHIDTAFKSLDSIARGDDSVIQVWGHDPEGKGLVYYIEGWGDNKMRVETFTEKLVDIIIRYHKEDKRIFKITDEQETGGKIGTWEALLRNACHDKKVPLPGGKLLVLKRGNKAKTRRILEAAAFWVEGHVKLVKGAPGVKKLISQMLRIGYSKHDDYADAASDVFAPEIYRAMRLHNRNTEEGVVPLRPGDELLRNGLMPTNMTELRSMYDAAAREDREHYTISTDNWPFS